MSVAKISLSLPAEPHAWLVVEHQRTGTSVSALVSGALARVGDDEARKRERAQRAHAAIADLAGAPLTEAELDAARAELSDLGLL